MRHISMWKCIGCLKAKPRCQLTNFEGTHETKRAWSSGSSSYQAFVGRIAVGYFRLQERLAYPTKVPVRVCIWFVCEKLLKKHKSFFCLKHPQVLAGHSTPTFKWPISTNLPPIFHQSSTNLPPIFHQSSALRATNQGLHPAILVPRGS